MTRKIIIALLIIAVFVLSGCKNGITGGAVVCNKPYILVGNDCCLDKNDNNICDKDEVEETAETVEPPKEEVVEVIVEEAPIPLAEQPEEQPETQSNEFLIKLGKSITFDKKKITLTGLENIPRLKAVFNVDGIEREVFDTKNLVIINNLEFTVLAYNNLESSVVVKIEKLDLGDNQIITPREDITFKGKKITLKDVQDSEAILLDVKDTKTEDISTNVIIKEGKSETVQGIKITNIDGFSSGVKAEEYAIIKVQ